MKRVSSSGISQLARLHNCLLVYLPCLTSAYPWTKKGCERLFCDDRLWLPHSLACGTSCSSSELPPSSCPAVINGACRLYPRAHVMLFIFVSQTLQTGSSCSILQLPCLLDATRTCTVKGGQDSLYRALVWVVWCTEGRHAGGIGDEPRNWMLGSKDRYRCKSLMKA